MFSPYTYIPSACISGDPCAGGGRIGSSPTSIMCVDAIKAPESTHESTSLGELPHETRADTQSGHDLGLLKCMQHMLQ